MPSIKLTVAVVIPTHCDSFILKLTLGTLLRHCKKHDLNIQLGLHKSYNVGDLHQGIFDQLRRISQVHLVDEIDWVANGENVNRYSLMHAKNLESLFQQIKYYSFDYVLVLDNDVHVKADFITELITRFPDSDLIGTYFGEGVEEFTRISDEKTLISFPRVAPWHLLMSRKLYNKIMEDSSVIYPVEIWDEEAIKERQGSYGIERNLPIFSDTFGEVLHHCRSDWNMKIGVVSSTQFEKWAHHFFFSSMSYGAWALDKDMPAHLEEIKKVYDTEFPNGLEF